MTLAAQAIDTMASTPSSPFPTLTDQQPSKMTSRHVFNVDLPHNMTTFVLSQFCGAATEPFTGLVSYIICKGFKISLKGTRNMNQGLNNLPCYRTPDEKLTFGWAMDNLIRSRAVHENAYEHLATMICLSESFHEIYAARVMYEMARMRAGTNDITPHFRQWRDVLHSLNGALACTDFGVVVEDYIRLDPYDVNITLREDLVNFPIRASAVATAILALETVTSGEQKQLTVIGSAIIAWLAAIADWIYDLRIAIFSIDGAQLHVTHPGQETQVMFVFEQKSGINVSNRPWTQDQAHIADCKSTSDFSYGTSLHYTPFSGRVQWQSVLPRVFGQSFHQLDHELSKDLATFLGTGARLLQGLAHGEGYQAEYTDLISAQNRANDSSYGIGLIQTFGNWLPELRRVQGRMERQLKMTGMEAATVYRDTMLNIRRACGCGVCMIRPDDAPVPEMPAHLSDVEPKPKHGYCLITLCETIVALGLTLSRIAVTSQLYPSRAGIQTFYHSQAMRRLSARGKHWTEHFKSVYGDEWNAPDSRRLVNVIQIFSGSRPTRYLPENLIAVSHEGICAYFMDLERAGRMRAPSVAADMSNLSLNDGKQIGPSGVKLIRLVSGGINMRHKVFDRAAWGRVDGKEFADEDPWERVDVDFLEVPLYCR